MFEQPDGFESRSGNLTITIGATGQAVFNSPWIGEGYISSDHTTWISNSFNTKTQQWRIQFVHETTDDPVSKEDQAKAGIISFSQVGGENPKVGITNVFKIALGQPGLLPEKGYRMRWSQSNANLKDFEYADPNTKVVILNCKDKEQELLTSASREEKLNDLVKLALSNKDEWREAIQKDKLWTNKDPSYKEEFEIKLRFMQSSVRDMERLEEEDS